MKLCAATVLALAFFSAATPATVGQSAERKTKHPAVYTGADFSMGCSAIRQVGWVAFCEGSQFAEFRMWDVKNPTRVTLIKATNVQYDLSTGEVKAEGNVTVTIENFPNRQSGSNRTLILPDSAKH